MPYIKYMIGYDLAEKWNRGDKLVRIYVNGILTEREDLEKMEIKNENIKKILASKLTEKK